MGSCNVHTYRGEAVSLYIIESLFWDPSVESYFGHSHSWSDKEGIAYSSWSVPCSRNLKRDRKESSPLTLQVEYCALQKWFNTLNKWLPQAELLIILSKDVEIRKIAYKALCCDYLKVTSQLLSFQSQNLSLVLSLLSGFGKFRF